MADVTAINSIPWPELTDVPNIETAVKPLADHIDTRLVPRFATQTARNTAIPSPVEGMVAYVNTHGLMIRNGAGWVPLPGTEIAYISNQSVQNVPEEVLTELTFDTDEYDPFSGHSTVSNPTRFVFPFPGRYRMIGNCTLTFAVPAPGPGSMSLLFKSNGTDEIPGSLNTAISEGIVGFQTDGYFTANGTTDYVELIVYIDKDASDPGAEPTFTDYRRPGMRVIYLGPSH